MGIITGMGATLCPGLSDADCCLRSDVMTDSRLQGYCRRTSPTSPASMWPMPGTVTRGTLRYCTMCPIMSKYLQPKTDPKPTLRTPPSTDRPCFSQTESAGSMCIRRGRLGVWGPLNARATRQFQSPEGEGGCTKPR